MLASPTTFSAISPSSIDDYLNLDPQDGSGIDFLSFSRQSSDSPASSTQQLPPTPTQPLDSNMTALDTVDFANNPVFQDLYRSYILPKTIPSDPLPSTSTMPTTFSFGDLFANYGLPNPADSLFTNSQPAGVIPPLPFAIDPQLMATPAVAPVHNPAPVAPSLAVPAPLPVVQRSPIEDSVLSDADDSEEDEDEMPVKSKGSGKGKKTSGVATGGIVKRTGPTSCVVRDPDSNDPDDWRPSPEEYKKLSSKEKRQLRNKISARNFRVRRKEYITTLEGHISDRDRLIEAIRQELGASRLENQELRQEVDALKKAMLEGKVPHPTGLPPPAALHSTTPLASSTNTAKRRTNTTLLPKANVNKDVAGSGTARPFWGGAVGLGGVTPVHATLIPDMHFPSSFATTSSVLSGKGLSGRFSPNVPQENINPLLNFAPVSPPSTPPQDPNDIAAMLNNAAASHFALSGQQSQTPVFDDINPFTIKSLDGYRMQLWGKMAAAQAQYQAQQQYHSSPGSSSSGSSPSPPNQFTQLPLFNQHPSLTSSLRPAFFTGSSKPSPTLSAILSGKASSSSSYYPTPPSSPPTHPTQYSTSQSSSQREAQAQAHATAFVAALASQSLMSRMGAAFWDAFSGSSSPNKGWDADKVRRVLEGKAVVRVVDVEEKLTASPLLKATSMAKNSPRLSPKAMANAADSLEESMRKMSIGPSLASLKDKDAVPECQVQVRECAGIFQNIKRS